MEEIWQDLEGLEGESEAAANAALILGDDQQRSVIHDVGTVTLGQQILHVKQRLTVVNPSWLRWMDWRRPRLRKGEEASRV